MKNQILKTHLTLLMSLLLILAPMVPSTLAHGISGFDADPLLPSAVPAGGNILVSFSYTVFHSHGSTSLPWQDPWVIRLNSAGGPILASGFSLHPARGETLTHRVSVTVTIPEGSPEGEHSLYIGVSDDPISTTRQWQYKTFTILKNLSPVADAGPDQSLEASGPDGVSVTLDAGRSHHPAGDSLIYQWAWPGQEASGVRMTSVFPLGATEVTLRVSDGKGGFSTDSVLVTVRDTTSPVSQITLDPAPPTGLNGWYTTSVEFNLSASDSGSAVARIEYNRGDGWTLFTKPVNISDQGSTLIQYRASDRAGNIEDIKSAEIKIDKTPPQINTQMNPAYSRWDTVNIIFSASEELSGLAELSARLDGNPTASEAKIEARTLSPGSHIMSVTASDHAGNTSEKTVSFTIDTTIDDLIALTKKLAERDNMDRGVYNSLEVKLNAARAALERSPLKDTAQSLRSFTREIKAQSGKHISEATALILIQEAEYLILKY